MAVRLRGESGIVQPFLEHLAPEQPVDREGRFFFLGPLHTTRTGWVLRVQAGEQELALRLLRPELVEEEADRELFAAWAEECARVEHSRLAKVVSYGFLPLPLEVELAFLAYPWVAGTTLKQLLQGRGKGLAAEQVFHFTSQVAAALAALHGRGLVHGELRPAVVVVDKRQNAKVLGAGVPPRLRRRAELMGFGPWALAPWAPPERLDSDGETTEPNGDVYQLGLLFYELLAGIPYPRWTPPDLPSELAEHMPPSADQLLAACLGDPALRPGTALEFLAKLRDVEASFEELQREQKRAPRLGAKQLREHVESLLSQQCAPFELAWALAQRGLTHRGPLPFSSAAERELKELADRARAGLRFRLRSTFERLVGGGDLGGAQTFLDRVAEELPAAELVELEVTLERARASAGPEQAQRAIRRLLQLLKQDLPFAAHLAVVEGLEGLLLGGRLLSAVAFVKPEGELLVVEPFWVGEERVEVVLGPALRLGRGPFAEFSNHVDLAPPLERVREDSALLLLAQTISRAGHLEFRVGAEGLEAFCLGTHGATVDGVVLGRGEATLLREEGEFNLARGAAVGKYRVVTGAEGEPWALTVELTAGVVPGKRAVWVFTRLPLRLLAPGVGDCGLLLPTPEGWVVEPWTEGLRLGGVLLPLGGRRVWQKGEELVLPGEVVARRRGEGEA